MDRQTVHHNEGRNQIRLVSIMASNKSVQCKCVYARKISYKCLNYAFYFEHGLRLYEACHDLMVFLRWCGRKCLDTNKMSSLATQPKRNVWHTVPAVCSNHAESPIQIHGLSMAVVALLENRVILLQDCDPSCCCWIDPCVGCCVWRDERENSTRKVEEEKQKIDVNLFRKTKKRVQFKGFDNEHFFIIFGSFWDFYFRTSSMWMPSIKKFCSFIYANDGVRTYFHPITVIWI